MSVHFSRRVLEDQERQLDRQAIRWCAGAFVAFSAVLLIPLAVLFLSAMTK